MIGDTANHTPTLVGVAGSTYGFLGLPFSAWVSIATILYLVVQTLAVLPKAIATINKLLGRKSDVESIDQSP